MSARITYLAKKIWIRNAKHSIFVMQKTSETSTFLNAVKDTTRSIIEIKNCEFKRIETDEERKAYGIRQDTTAVILFMKSSFPESLQANDIIEWDEKKFLINAFSDAKDESENYGISLIRIEVKQYGN